MTTLLAFAVIALWLVVMAMGVMMFLMLRQIGVLYERVAPVGALMDSSGPKMGEAAPALDLQSLTGGTVSVGRQGERSTLLFFLSPTCPVCKKLLPALARIRDAEGGWVDVVLASDGAAARHHAFIAESGLRAFPYVLSTELGMAFRVQRLPYAVLIDSEGVVRAKGLINNREQLESLFNAADLGVASMQEMLARRIGAAP